MAYAFSDVGYYSCQIEHFFFSQALFTVVRLLFLTILFSMNGVADGGEGVRFINIVRTPVVLQAI